MQSQRTKIQFHTTRKKLKQKCIRSCCNTFSLSNSAIISRRIHECRETWAERNETMGEKQRIMRKISNTRVPGKFWSQSIRVYKVLNLSHTQSELIVTAVLSVRVHWLFLAKRYRLQNHSSHQSKPKKLLIILNTCWMKHFLAVKENTECLALKKATPRCSTPTMHPVWDPTDKILLDKSRFLSWVMHILMHTVALYLAVLQHQDVNKFYS